MIHKDDKYNKPVIESAIHNSVRAQILKFLEDKQPKRFSEITRKLNKPDTVISRELKILGNIEDGGRGWINKTGSGRETKYTLNSEMKKVNEFLTKLNAIPDPDSAFYPVNLDLTRISSEAREREPDLQVEFTLPHLDMVIAGEKIDGFEDEVKDLEKNYELLAAIAKFMGNIVRSRATKKMLNYRAKMEKEGRKMDKEAALDDRRVYGETFQEEFKLIISWRQERYGPLVSGSLPEYMYRRKTTSISQAE